MNTGLHVAALGLSTIFFDKAKISTQGQRNNVNMRVFVIFECDTVTQVIYHGMHVGITNKYMTHTN